MCVLAMVHQKSKITCTLKSFLCTADDSKLKVSESTDSTKDYQHIAAQTFTFHELAVATKNFRSDCLIGEGGFGRVYKGRLESTGQESPCSRCESFVFLMVNH